MERDIRNILTRSRPFWPADYGNYGPLLIRLAWHAAGSYRTYDGRGGADGGRMRFEPERSWEDNTNLDKARRLLEPIKKKYGYPLSWGDLIILAGNVAIKEMGGPVLGFCGGRVDDKDGNASILLGPTEEQERFFPCPEGTLCKEPLGSSVKGLIYVNPVGPLGKPDPIHSAKDITDVFGRMAMNDSETVALIAGGHEFGKSHGACPSGAGDPPNENEMNPWEGKCGYHDMKGKGPNTFTSGLELVWTSNPIKWEYEYIDNLLKYEAQWKKYIGPGGSGKWQWKIQGFYSKVPSAPNVDGSGRQDIGMLTSDVALLRCPKYFEILKNFHNCKSCLDKAFMHAWYKLTTRDMGPRSRCINDNAPPAQPWQLPLPEAPKNIHINYERIKNRINEIMNEDPKMRGKFARLSWQCSSNFRSTDYFGGCNGARIRLKPQKDWSVNENLEIAFEKLSLIKSSSESNLSWSDLIILAGNVAIEYYFERNLSFCPGRTDAKEGGGGPDYLKPKIGDAYDKASLDKLKDAIETSGLTKPEFTALYGGGYHIGDTEDCNGLFCNRRAFVKDKVLVPLKGSSRSFHHRKTPLNKFFKDLFENQWEPMAVLSVYNIKGITIFKAKGNEDYMLPQDLFFRDDPELSSVSKDFARDQRLFEDTFLKAWTKLANIDRFKGPMANECD